MHIFLSLSLSLSLAKVRDFYQEMVKRLLGYLPLGNKLLRALRFINPKNICGPDFDIDDVLITAKALPNVIPENKIDDLRIDVTKLRLSEEVDSSLAPEEFWSVHVTPERYPHLVPLARAACCIPHGNADSERFLKWVANNMTKQRNQLSDISLMSLLTIKNALKIYGVTPGTVPVDEELLKAGFSAKHKAEVRAKALREEQERKKKELKQIENTMILEKAASESLKKKQEAQKKRDAELKKQQDDVDYLRKQAQDLLRVANEREEELRKRQNEQQRIENKMIQKCADKAVRNAAKRLLCSDSTSPSPKHSKVGL